MALLRRLAGCLLAVGAFASLAAAPAGAAAPRPSAVPATSAAPGASVTPADTAVGPVRVNVPGYGNGPGNVAYQYALNNAYGMAEQTYGYAASQCPVTWGPALITQLPSGYTEYAVVLTCTGWPPKWTAPAYTLTRYWNGSSDHMSTLFGAPLNYSSEGPLGKLYATGSTAGTHPLYMCQVGKDTFTSLDVNCEGQSYVTRLGWIYNAPPSGLTTQAVHRCRIRSNGEHFDSLDAGCEGQIVETVLGYALA